MKRRLLSLTMALALCLSLLPVTAGAEAAEGAPNSLYVGDQQVINGNDITYWTTGTDGGLTQVSDATDDSDNWNVKYDPNSATLTLNEATIQGGSNTGSVPFGAGIYALSSVGQPVALTIELIGENTITGNYGIYVNAQQANTLGTNASLSITGNGSLTVTGTTSYGLYVKSGTGNASLTIENASVNATSSVSSSGYAGVCVESSSSATAPVLSLAVNGGSLTASGTGSSDGIWFYVGSPQATGATTSLTVSENAIVDTRNGGISASRISGTLPTPTPTDENSSGIVFDGSDGTVYGKVELKNDLEIASGETLTIGQDASLTVPEGTTLTNSGTINVEDGGTVTGSLNDGTTLTPPSISQQPQSTTVTEGSTAEFSITASNAQTYQWQRKATDTGSEWENISDATTTSYTTAATTTIMSGYQYRCVVTSASGVSVISNAATLTVNQSVTPTSYSISANVAPTGAGTVTVNGSGTSATVTANSDVTLTATANEGYRFTGWTSSGGGTFVNASSESTTFIMPASDVTVTAQFAKVVTGVTLDKETLELFTDGSATLTAAVEPSDATNQNVTWQSDNANVATVQNGTVTAVGAGEATITVQTQDGNYTATCKVTVTQRSSGSSGGSSTPTKTPSQQATDKIEAAKDGSTVEITLRTGQTKLDKEVFEELSGRDVTLEISLPGGITWTVNGQDIPENAVLTDLDMGVRMDAGSVPVDILNAITGEIGTMQLSLAHDGEFGFTLTLTAPLGAKNAGYWANLYYYHEDAESLTFQTSAKIDPDGSAALAFTHASDYVIVIDDRDHTPKEFPFVDVTTDDWFYEAADYVFQRDLMTGTDETHFTPDGTSTRAMVATILWRMAGEPQADYTMAFADVPVSAWYTEAVRWAASQGIVTGYSATKFGPDDPVTREQFAAMLYRYAQTLGEGFTGSWSFPLDFPDAADVSDYAYEALCWLTMQNVIQGMEDGNLHPQGTATRAQLATMLMRFCQATDQ